MKKVFLLVLLFVGSYVSAQTIPASMSFTWTAPTQGCAGQTCMPLTGPLALTKYQLFVSPSPIADNATLAPVSEPAASAVSTVYNTTVPNNSSLYGRIKACNVNGCSVFSMQVVKAFSLVIIPDPPLLTISTTAYRQVLNAGPSGRGDVVMVAAGTVPIGITCDATQSTTTYGAVYYRVDKSLVTFTGNNRPTVMWGRCS